MAGRPGLGAAAAARSSVLSSDDTNEATVDLSGRGRPDGGIVPLCSFLTTFSQVSARCGTFSVSMRVFSSTRLPAFVRSLWQAMQYLSRSARCSVGDIAAGAGVVTAAWLVAALVPVAGAPARDTAATAAMPTV